jgi:hypothetical protein
MIDGALAERASAEMLGTGSPAFATTPAIKARVGVCERAAKRPPSAELGRLNSSRCGLLSKPGTTRRPHVCRDVMGRPGIADPKRRGPTKWCRLGASVGSGVRERAMDDPFKQARDPGARSNRLVFREFNPREICHAIKQMRTL